MAENPVPPAAAEAAKEAVKGIPLWAKAANSKYGKLIIEHPGKTAGIVALIAAMTAWLWPSKKEEETQPDGSVETKEKWGFGKKAAVGLGAIVSAGLVAHYAPGGPTKDWVTRVGKKAADLSAKGI